MIFLICLCHFTINPWQTRRGTSPCPFNRHLSCNVLAYLSNTVLNSTTDTRVNWWSTNRTSILDFLLILMLMPFWSLIENKLLKWRLSKYSQLPWSCKPAREHVFLVHSRRDPRSHHQHPKVKFWLNYFCQKQVTQVYSWAWGHFVLYCMCASVII